jgi:hypothetical protein
MSPTKKKTSTRHAKAKRAAKRSGRSARVKRAARKSGEPGAPARGPKKKTARRPSLQVVARPAPKPLKPRTPVEVTEFSGAKAGATPKDLALFGLERARVAVHAAIQGLGPGAADRPIAPGKWSPRQMVLHLAFWDREIVQKHLEPAAALNQRADIRRSRLDAMNAAGLAPLAHHDWEAAKRLLQTTHEHLWEAFNSIPAEPAEVWSPEHAVGELVREVTGHDRHHAEIIKRWRAETGA